MKPTNKLMKRLSLYLFLIFFTLPTLSQADDIRDFQIEGMSVKNSLLDYYTLSEIKKSLLYPTFYPKSKKFKVIKFKSKNNELYDAIQFHIKDNDKNYIIYTIKGTNYTSIDQCLSKKKNVVKEIKTIMPNAKIKEYIDDYRKAYGNSKAYVNNFYLKSGNLIRVWCSEYDMDNATVKKKSWNNNLNVSVYTKEFRKWLDEEAYK